MSVKKVFPMDEQPKSARQRADRMLARAAGLINEGPDELHQQNQKPPASFDDDHSLVTIQSR